MLLLLAPAVAHGAGTARFASSPARRGAVRALSVSPGRSVDLVFGLRRRQAALGRFVDRVSDPASPAYRRFASPAQIDRRFGASPATRRAALRELRALGIRARIGPTGAFASATVPAAVAQRVFSTRLSVYRSVAGARFVAPERSPRLPPALAPYVDVVAGLDDGPMIPPPGATAAARAARVRVAAPVATAGSGYEQRTGTATGCAAALARPSFAPNQYREAYGYARLARRGFRGEGQRVALTSQAPFLRSDVTTFARCFGLRAPPTPVTNLDRTPPPPSQSEIEMSLDIDMVVATAPGLKAIDVYQASTAAGFVRMYAEPSRVPKWRRPNVLSSSLVSCEPYYDPSLLRLIEHAIEADAAVGVTVVSGSGDSGSSSCTVSGQGAALGLLMPSFPGSSPYATSVGGTNITLDAANRITSEVLWNDEPLRFLAGGGAQSTVFARPAYQRARHIAGATRSTPDVAMLADHDPGIIVYCHTPICVSGTQGGGFLVRGWGTSAAGPLFGGGIALANQQAAVHGQPPLGPVNPLIYHLARHGARPPVFRDITHGSNDLGAYIPASAQEDGIAPLGCCAAHRGYDLASGWGSVNFAALADAAVTAGRRAAFAGRRDGPSRR